MIAAVASNRVIGNRNQLPWRLPADLQYFKRTTLGKPLLMGRRTFESIGRPLPGRRNIVLSRSAGWEPPGVCVVHCPARAIEVARAEGAGELMVIGGEEVYRLLFERAQRLYLTEVHAEFEGDALFPRYDPGDWREVSRERHGRSQDNPWDHSFVVLERVPAAPARCGR